MLVILKVKLLTDINGNEMSSDVPIPKPYLLLLQTYPHPLFALETCFHHHFPSKMNRDFNMRLNIKVCS